MDVRSVGSRSGTAAAVLALVAAGSLQGQERGLREFDETRQAARDATVQVETLTRTVRVTGWDREEVRVRGALDPAHEELLLDGDRGSVRIAIEHGDDRGAWRRERGRDPGPLTVSVPRGAAVEVDAVNGSVIVEKVDGAVDLESVNGEIGYSGDAERISAETVNGRVELEAPGARRTRAGSVNGDLTLRVGGGFVEAEAVSGRLDIRAEGPVEALSAETVAGEVDFRGRPVRGANLSFETHSGNVVLHLPRDLDARLEATTFSGSIESAFGGEVRSSSRWTSERSLRHTVGDGGTRVTAESFSGNVRFLELED